MSPRHRSTGRETIVSAGRYAIDYDHNDQRYELRHTAFDGYEARTPFVAVDVGAQDFRLLRRREIGPTAKGVEIEANPVEVFGETIGDVLEAIAAGDHPPEADHV